MHISSDSSFEVLYLLSMTLGVVSAVRLQQKLSGRVTLSSCLNLCIVGRMVSNHMIAFTDELWSLSLRKMRINSHP